MDATATSPEAVGHRELAPGQWLGRVLLVQKVATGGMGEVWEGRQQPLERRVAVKFLRREFADDPTIRARFVGEARALASVDHPGIVAVHDVHDDPPAIVMSYVEGVSLRTWISQSDMPPWTRVRELLVQVAEALEAVHRAGIVHRDLKPDNVMVSHQTDGDQVTVIDFGIARQSDGPRLTGTSLLGTPEYMSPEQWRGEVADARTDIYALGCLAFELLTGDPPFIGPSTTLLRREHQEDPPDPPTLIRTDLAEIDGLDQIVARCLAKSQKDRFPSMSAVVDALRAVDTAPAIPATTSNGGPRRNRLALAALAMSGLAAAVAVSAAWAAWTKRDDVRPSASTKPREPLTNDTPSAPPDRPAPVTQSPPSQAERNPTAPPAEPLEPTTPVTTADRREAPAARAAKKPRRTASPRQPGQTPNEATEARGLLSDLTDLPRRVGPG